MVLKELKPGRVYSRQGDGPTPRYTVVEIRLKRSRPKLAFLDLLAFGNPSGTYLEDLDEELPGFTDCGLLSSLLTLPAPGYPAPIQPAAIRADQ